MIIRKVSCLQFLNAVRHSRSVETILTNTQAFHRNATKLFSTERQSLRDLKQQTLGRFADNHITFSALPLLYTV